MIDLCISNICWDKHPVSFLDMCVENGVSKIEIAPTKIVSSVYNNNDSVLRSFLHEVKSRNMTIESMQSIFYNNQSNIFLQKKQFLDHLRKVFEIAKKIECDYLVFGSPKNREIPNSMKKEEAWDFFCETMEEISEILNKEYDNLKLALEANPQQYGCNFMTNYLEAKEILEKVKKENIVFHLDTACTLMSGKNFENAFVENKKYIHKIHLSEPYLEPVINNTIDYEKIFKILKKHNYNGVVSIEMKPSEQKNIVLSIKLINKFVEIYE